MTREEFKLIYNTWDNLLNQAKKNYDKILVTEDLENLSVKELKALVDFSKYFIGQMDNLFCDYRHIVGMSKIKPTDRSKLTSILKSIESYRSDAKRIASINSLDLVKLIPAQSTYQLKLTPSIKLISDLRPGQEKASVILEDKTDQESTISAFTNIKFNSPTSFLFDLIHVDEVKALFSKIGCAISLQKLSETISNNGSANGIKFSIMQDGKYQGAAHTDKARTGILKLCSKLGEN